MPDFEVIIIGAGPAGSVAALLLARAGLKVALLERARFPRDKVCGDGITPRGARLLNDLGILGPIKEAAFACSGVTLRGSDSSSFDIDLKDDARGPSQLLVLPRLQLDQMLLDAALDSGCNYRDGCKVLRVERQADEAVVVLDTAEQLRASVVFIATGAESQVLRASGLLAEKPHLEHAARGYFDGVEGLDARVTLFFDGVDMPGYGWIFPTSASSANIGCGVFARRGMPQMERLRELIKNHPLLKRQLANATLAAPLRAYPLRTDFEPRFAGQERMLCLGEAAGLVNPITGEGIDYAFESARFAAEAVLGSLAKDGGRSAIDTYRGLLTERFARRFAIYRWVQQRCLSSGQAEDFLGAVKRSPALQQTVVNGLFGRARPIDYLQPAVLWPALRIAMRGAWRNRLSPREEMP